MSAARTNRSLVFFIMHYAVRHHTVVDRRPTVHEYAMQTDDENFDVTSELYYLLKESTLSSLIAVAAHW